ncbi:hypothetical protein [Actinomadura sp. 7K534]|uniref:hypothetical protein n=1 Tax=Actinomadura sp. 7K534 TaxID=2530366 RepID=UPI00104C644B|nr:hypothetical protein [Actinomadura sp. 7K534]TDB94981.1 hypothetical protein E1266_14730 [Actinomadura sp. 7K534]
MRRRLPLFAASLALLTTVAACSSGGDSDGDPANGGDGPRAAVDETITGRMGGAGPRKNRANLHLNIGSLSNRVGTENGAFGMFEVECSPKKVTVSAGDGVRAEFTVGSQEVVFFHDGEEFGRFTDDDIRWGAGSSFEGNLVQKSWGEGDAYRRATFTGSVDCPAPVKTS